jgi:hypothetical protein
MAQLAIIGHTTRGKEVIEILEMLGGVNTHNLYGDEKYTYYTIDSDKEIKGGIYVFCDEDLLSFALEEFLEKFPYKVGDKVLYKTYGIYSAIRTMKWNSEKEQVFYRLDSKNLFVASTDDLKPYKEETMKNKLEQITLDIPNGYEFFGIDDDNKIVLTKKQPLYPKTYDECAQILLERASVRNDIGYKGDLLIALQRLLVCRDAYWKIAGDWKFDFENPCYYLCNEFGSIQKYEGTIDYSAILTFPTKEMRDAFYENFKDLIELCKELL